MSRIWAIPCLLLLSALANSAYAFALVGPGYVINAGDVICSPNLGGASGCDYTLTMQTDGNLVMYNGSGSAVWSTGTHGSGATHATMQTDGNLVLYTASGTSVWASNTHGDNGAYLAVEDNGNLDIYVTVPSWATNTSDGVTGTASTDIGPGTVLPVLPSSTPPTTVRSPNGAAILTVEVCCVYLNYGTSSVWYAPIPDDSTVELAQMQADGNFVVYNTDGQALWSTNTQNNPGSFLSLQGDGNMVVYSPSAVWTRQSGASSPPSNFQTPISVVTLCTYETYGTQSCTPYTP